MNDVSKTSINTQQSKKGKKGGAFSRFVDFLCCRDEEEEQNRKDTLKLSMARPSSSMDLGNKLTRSPSPQDSFMQSGYPVDKIIIIGNSHKIVCKFTLVNVAKKSSVVFPEQRTSIGRSSSKSGGADSTSSANGVNMKEIFRLYDKGIQADSTVWNEITPEVIGSHIGKRTACNVIIDALCGYGGTCIQFAKYSNFVIGIENQMAKAQAAKHNAEIYKVAKKIDFLTGDFFKFRNLWGETIFLDPSEIPRKSGEKFSIAKHLNPNLQALFAKAIELCPNVVIKLPKEADIEELAKIVNLALDSKELYSRRFCMEVEKMVNESNEMECMVVYFGDLSTIKLDEEYQAVYNYILQFEDATWQEQNPFPYVSRIIEKIGIKKTFKLFTDIENEIQHMPKKPQSMFQIYLERLHKANFLTKEAVKRIYDFESKQKLFIPLHGKQLSVSSGSSKTDFIPLRDSVQPSESTSPLSAIKRSKELSRKTGGNTSPNGDLSQINSLTLRSQAYPLEASASYKNSLEVSDLAISQYSVESNYLEGLDGEDDKNIQSVKDDPFITHIEETTEGDEDGDPDDRERDMNRLAQELTTSDPAFGKKKNRRKNKYMDNHDDTKIVMEGLEQRKRSSDVNAKAKMKSFVMPSNKDNSEEYF